MNDFIHRNNVNRMAWPAVSPDLSCTEHAWDVLGRAVSASGSEQHTARPSTVSKGRVGQNSAADYS